MSGLSVQSHRRFFVTGPNYPHGGNDALSWGAPGGLLNGQVLQIDTDGTYDFTTKANAKALLFWEADNGIDTFDAALSRKTAWDGVPNGEISSVIVAPGSSQAVRYSHSSSGAILGEVHLASDQAYMFRKFHHDFDISTDFARRCRVNITSGSPPLVGDVVRGKTTNTNVWGVIQSIHDEVQTGRTHRIMFEPGLGTIDDLPYETWDNNQDLEIDGKPSILLTCEEGQGGPFKTFNFKTARMWHDADNNNTYWGPIPTSGPINKGAVVSEYTQTGTYWHNSWENQVSAAFESWQSEEFIHQISAIDVEDGISEYRRDGESAFSSKRFRHRTTAYPNRYDQIFQTQVSNGAQPGSYTYADALYIDDTWHRVVISDRQVWDVVNSKVMEVQPITAWSQNQIQCQLRDKRLAGLSGKWMHVFDNTGNPINVNGLQLAA